MTKRILELALLVLVAIVTPAIAQDETPTSVNVQNRSGDLPFSVSIGTDIEHVDVASGNLIVRIPFTSVKGRGMNFSFGLNYDARYWNVGTRHPNGQPLTQVWNIGIGNYVPAVTTGFGWQPNQGRLTWTNTKVSCSVSMPQTMYALFQSHFIYHDSEGGNHSLAVRSGTASCDSGSFVLSDLQGPDLSGSGMFARIPTTFKTPAAYQADGTQVAWSANGGTFVPPPQFLYTGNQLLLGTFEDSNGNTLQQYAGGLDTLGRAIVTQQNGTNQILYKIYDSSGTQRTYTVNYGNISLATHFAASDVYGAIQEYTGTRSAVTSIVLPNGKSYLFQYETSGYGAISRIDLPTGGYITYTWGTIYNSGQGAHAFRYVTNRTVHSDGLTFSWTYAMNCPTTDPYSGVICTNTVTDPLSQQSVYNVTNGNITIAKIYSGSATGTPLRQYDITYAPYSDAYGNPESTLQIPSIIKTTMENSQVSKKEFDHDTVNYSWSECDESDPESGCPTDPNTGQLLKDTLSTTRGNVTEMREFDWAPNNPGALIRRTKFAYLHNSDSNYLTYNIVNKVITQTVCNGVVSCVGNGDQSAQTQYEYDMYIANDNAQVPTSNAAQHDYTIYSSSFKYRGNATRVKRWRNTDSALLTTTYTYDDLGNMRAIKDPLLHSTSYDYADSFANSSCPPPSGKNGQAYVSTVTNALSQLTKIVRFPCTSLLQAHKDQNDINAGRAGTTYVYDLLGRPTQKSLPDNGQTNISYNDAPPVSSTSTITAAPSPNIVNVTVRDGLGRVAQSQLTSDPEGTDYTDTVYDALGRVSSVSNPHRSGTSSTDGKTISVYDTLNRVCVVVPPDGTVVSSCPATPPANDIFTLYGGNCVTVTDHAGKIRKSCSDAPGRLTSAVEDPSGLNYQTTYTYDALDDLTNVVQVGSRQRTFTYNSLSQLLTAGNPESGTITYTYDDGGNLWTKKDARSVKTTYTYDPLNRNMTKTYSDGTPTATFQFDTGYSGFTPANPIGRMTVASTSTTMTNFSYDPVGRIAIRGVCTSANCTSGGWGFFYNYDYAGHVIQFNDGVYTFPQDFVPTYDGAGRVTKVTSSVSDANHPATLFTVDASSGYFPNGALRKATFANGLTQSNVYDKRLQPCRINLNSSATILTACADAIPSGNVLDVSAGFNLGVSDNGNVASWAATGNQTFSRTYGYDTLNRLKTMADSATAQACKGLSWTYDAWGNRTDQTVTAGTCGTFHQAVDTNNRFVGAPYTYDAAGDMTHDASHSYAYDAENRIKTVDGGSTAYVYDAFGKRAVKTSGGNTYEYVYDNDGNIGWERLNGNINRAYLWSNGSLLAEFSQNLTYFIHSDHLGSSRLLTAYPAPTIIESHDYYPFGEDGTTGIPLKFTGKEYDTESGLDNFGARYYSSSMGRFMIPDWSAKAEPVPYAKMDNPQSLNLYSYVKNSPLNSTDPEGHCEIGCAIVVSAVVGYLTYKAAQLYYHSQEMAAAQESYKADTELLQQVVSNPNGQAESQIDLNNLAHSIQSDEAKLGITGSQVASDAVGLANGAASAGRAAASSGAPSSSAGVDAGKAVGAGVKVGTKAVKELVKATQEKPGQQQQQQQRQQPPPPSPATCTAGSEKKC